MNSINLWPILVASIAAFAVSALWYSSVLFGDEWMSLLKIGEKDVAAAKARGMTKLYVLQFAMSFVSFCVLAFLTANTSSLSASDGAFLGFLVWLGFISPLGVSALLWEKRPLKLVLIDLLCVLLNTVIGGAIIGAWH